MDRRTKFEYIGKCLNRYEDILDRQDDLGNLARFRRMRFDRMIDLDVCGVDLKALAESDDETFMHDCDGIFENLVRNGDEPEKSELKAFVPRVGFEKKGAA